MFTPSTSQIALLAIQPLLLHTPVNNLSELEFANAIFISESPVAQSV